MRVACLGGGPAGLYFAISMKLRDPGHEVVVFERNKPDDTFGWGVVLSDETLNNLAENDAKSAEAIRGHFSYWDDVAVLYRGEKTVSTGHGFCGIGRKQLLILLQQRARELGVELRFETEAESAAHYAKEFDLVVASDGLNSKTRTEFADKFQPYRLGTGRRMAPTAETSKIARRNQARNGSNGLECRSFVFAESHVFRY